MPTGACSEPKLPTLLSAPEATLKEVTFALPALLANRNPSLGLSSTTVELIAPMLNGLPATAESTPLAPTVQASASDEVALASAPKSRPLVELKSRPARVAEPVSANGEPATAASEPSALMVYTETVVSLETARNCPLAEIFMLAFGATELAAVESALSTPPAPMLKVLI